MQNKHIQIFAFCLAIVANTVASNPVVNPISDRSLGQTFIFASDALSEERQIDLYLPDSYHFSNKTYPVIYVMDSGFLFDLTVSLLRNRWSRNLAPESIIVGIHSNSNPQRFGFAMPMKRDNGSISFEGSKPELMSTFLSNELTRYLKSNYRTNNFKAIIGMSPTATNVIYDFLQPTPFFNAHIAIAADMQFKTLQDKPLSLAVEEQANKHKEHFIMLSRASTDLNNNPAIGVPYQYLIDKSNSTKNNLHAFLPSETEHYSVAAQTIDVAFSKLFPMSQWRPNYRSLRNSDDPVPYLDEFYKTLNHQVGFETYPVVDGYWMGNNILGLARALGRNDRYPQALELLIWADNKMPDNVWINQYISRVYTRLEKPSDALKYAQKALNIANSVNHPDKQIIEEYVNSLTSGS